MHYSFLTYAYLIIQKTNDIFEFLTNYQMMLMLLLGDHTLKTTKLGGLTTIPHSAYVITCCELHATELWQRLFTVLRLSGW